MQRVYTVSYRQSVYAPTSPPPNLSQPVDIESVF